MFKKFKEPNFRNGILELRFENNEICIYGTRLGLQRLSEFCQKLINKPQIGHVHLEDYEILTPDSLIGAVAIFEAEDQICAFSSTIGQKG